MVISRFWTVALLLHALLLAGCSQTPIARLDSYLGLPTQGATAITTDPIDKSSGPFDVGLLVINDFSAQGSAPALSDKARAFLTDQVRRRVETTLPIRIVTVLAGAEAALPHDSQKLRQLVQERTVPYILLALFSSAESEVPTYLDSAALPNREVGGPTCPASRRIIMPWLNWPLWMSRRDNSSLVQTTGPGRNYCVSPCRSSRMCTRSFTARCGQLRSIRRKIRPRMSCAASQEMKRLNRPSCICKNYGPSAAHPSRQ
jgi:hypothetical protein